MYPSSLKKKCGLGAPRNTFGASGPPELSSLTERLGVNTNSLSAHETTPKQAAQDPNLKRDHGGGASIVTKEGTRAGGCAGPCPAFGFVGDLPCFGLRAVVVVATGIRAAILHTFLESAFQVSLRVRGAPKRRRSQNREGAGGNGGRSGRAVRRG